MRDWHQVLGKYTEQPIKYFRERGSLVPQIWEELVVCWPRSVSLGRDERATDWAQASVGGIYCILHLFVAPWVQEVYHMKTGEWGRGERSSAVIWLLLHHGTKKQTIWWQESEGRAGAGAGAGSGVLMWLLLWQVVPSSLSVYPGRHLQRWCPL